MRPGAGEGRVGEGGGRDLLPHCRNASFAPSVWASLTQTWSHQCFGRVLPSTGARRTPRGIQCQAHMPLCFWTAILKTQMKTFNKKHGVWQQQYQRGKVSTHSRQKKFPSSVVQKWCLRGRIPLILCDVQPHLKRVYMGLLSSPHAL